MTVTIPAIVLFGALLVFALYALLFGRRMGGFRYLFAGVAFLVAAFMITSWTVGALVLAGAGVLCLLGFIDVVRAKK